MTCGVDVIPRRTRPGLADLRFKTWIHFQVKKVAGSLLSKKNSKQNTSTGIGAMGLVMSVLMGLALGVCVCFAKPLTGLRNRMPRPRATREVHIVSAPPQDTEAVEGQTAK